MQAKRRRPSDPASLSAKEEARRRQAMSRHLRGRRPRSMRLTGAAKGLRQNLNLQIQKIINTLVYG